MPEPLALTLLSSTAISASGASSAVAVTGLQRVARLKADVTAFSGSSAVTLVLERRDDAADSWETSATVSIGAVGVFDISGEIGAQARVSYTVPGGTTLTIGVKGTMYTVYAKPSDLTRLNVKDDALSELSSRKIVDACIAASDDADSTFATRYTLPLVSWSEAVTKNVGDLAVAIAFSARGFNPNGPDVLVHENKKAAVTWLATVQAGRKEPGIVDSTPTTYQAGVVARSRPKQTGW